MLEVLKTILIGLVVVILISTPFVIAHAYWRAGVFLFIILMGAASCWLVGMSVIEIWRMLPND